MRLLVVEDEPKIARHLASGLEAAGFQVETCATGEAALDRARSAAFDALLVDVMLPGMSGLEAVRRLRSEGLASPVLFLSARDSTEDRVRGLNEGGDDYIVKPFALAEVLARIRAILRRSSLSPAAGPVKVADLAWEPGLRRITREGRRVDLTPKEYALATLLLQHRGEVVSRAQIARAVWGLEVVTDGNAVDVQVRRLRRKLDDPFEVKLIHTLRGVGVVLEARP
jgi:two-component system copper resistance phosphate regulon response regulator CusR